MSLCVTSSELHLLSHFHFCLKFYYILQNCTIEKKFYKIKKSFLEHFFKICIILITLDDKKQRIYVLHTMNEWDLVRDHKSNQGYFFAEKKCSLLKILQIIKGQLILSQVACTSGISWYFFKFLMRDRQQQFFNKCLVLYFVKPNKFEFILNLFMSFCMIFSYVILG